MPCRLLSKGAGVYSVTFLPQQSLRHLVYVTFSGEPVPGSPFALEVQDDTLVVARGRSLEATPLNKRALFEIDPSKAPFKANATVNILGT